MYIAVITGRVLWYQYHRQPLFRSEIFTPFEMPSKKQYNLVQNDDYDTRIPLHSDEAFQHGITFQAKVFFNSFYSILLGAAR